MRDRIATALELGGLASLSTAAFLTDMRLGIVVLGACLLAAGIGLGRNA